MTHLLDTHAVVWALANDAQLGDAAAEVILNAEDEQLAIADVTLLELAMLVDKKRIEIPTTTKAFLRVVASHFTVLPIDTEIAASAVELALPQADPFDRVILATAIEHKLTLLTKERRLTQCGRVPVIW